MTSFFHDLENQLRGAARERTGASGPDPEAGAGKRAGWLGRGLRAVPAIVAVAVTLAIVGAALVLLVPGHGHPNPPAGGPAGLAGAGGAAQQRKEFGYIAAASKSVQGSAACRTHMDLRTRFIRATPGRALLSTLGVLRRPGTAADSLNASALGGGTTVYSGYVRRALTVAGTSYYVVATRSELGKGMPSPTCFAEQERALKQELPKLPAPLREPTVRLQARLIQIDGGLARRPAQDTICFVAITSHSGSTECGATVRAIRNGQGPTNPGPVYSGVVPDGVASVTLRFPASSRGPARSFTATAQNDVYAVRLPPALAAGNPQARVTVVWQAADGATLRTIPPFNARTAARECARHPAMCASQAGSSVSGYAYGSASSSSASATASAPSQSARPPGSGAATH